MSMNSVPILRIGKILLTSIQFELEDKIVDSFQDNLLSTIEKCGATGLIIDISCLDNLDSYVARKIVDSGKMARLMGTETVIVGMRPEVAGTLVRMGFKFQIVHAALSLEEGLELLNKLSTRKFINGES